MPPLSSLCPRVRLTVPPPPSSLSIISWSRKHTGASAVGHIHSDGLYLLLPQLAPPLSSSRPRAARKHTLAPPPPETFTQTRCIFCFLNLRLRCHRRDLGIIFLFRNHHCGRQFLRPVIATHQHPPLSPNIQSLRHIVYSLSSANASVIVVDSLGQAVKDYLPLGFWLRISSGDGFHLWLLGVVVYPTLLDTAPLKTVAVQTEYLDYLYEEYTILWFEFDICG